MLLEKPGLTIANPSSHKSLISVGFQIFYA